MRTPEEDLRRLADALAERVVVPPFARVEARRRRRRARLVAVPLLAAASVALGALAVHAVQSGASPTTAAGSLHGASHSALAANPVPRCASAELTTELTVDRSVRDRPTASVRVGTTSSTPCSLAGPLQITAVDGNTIVESPGTVPPGALSRAAHVTVLLADPERRTCATGERKAPTELVLSFSPTPTLVVRDGALRELATCHGRLAVERVQPAA